MYSTEDGFAASVRSYCVDYVGMILYKTVAVYLKVVQFMVRFFPRLASVTHFPIDSSLYGQCQIVKNAVLLNVLL